MIKFDLELSFEDFLNNTQTGQNILKIAESMDSKLIFITAIQTAYYFGARSAVQHCYEHLRFAPFGTDLTNEEWGEK